MSPQSGKKQMAAKRGAEWRTEDSKKLPIIKIGAVTKYLNICLSKNCMFVSFSAITVDKILKHCKTPVKKA